MRLPNTVDDEYKCFVVGKGSGMPQVFNDEVIIPGQIARGVTEEDARNYAVVGCVELSTPSITRI